MHYEEWKMKNSGRNRITKKEYSWTPGEKENYKYLGTLDTDTIKQADMKGKIRKEYLRKTRKLLGTKLSVAEIS